MGWRFLADDLFCGLYFSAAVLDHALNGLLHQSVYKGAHEMKINFAMLVGGEKDWHSTSNFSVKFVTIIKTPASYFFKSSNDIE